jgi:TPR repeat protein
VAELSLGILYQQGWGVNRDPEKAIALYTEAAKSSDPSVATSATKLRDALRAYEQPATAANYPTSHAQDTPDWDRILDGIAKLADIFGAMGHGNTDGGQNFQEQQEKLRKQQEDLQQQRARGFYYLHSVQGMF